MSGVEAELRGGKSIAGIDFVIARLAVDLGVSGNGLNVDFVVARSCVYSRDAGMRALDQEPILPGTEINAKHLDIAIGDPAVERQAGDDGIITHAESGEPGRSEFARLVGNGVLIVNVQNVDLFGLDGGKIRIGCRDEFVRVGFARVDRKS